MMIDKENFYGDSLRAQSAKSANMNNANHTRGEDLTMNINIWDVPQSSNTHDYKENRVFHSNYHSINSILRLVVNNIAF